MNPISRLHLWKWSSRFLRLVLTVSALMIVDTLVSYTFFAKAFLESPVAGGSRTFLFMSQLILQIMVLGLWFQIYRRTLGMVNRRLFEERGLLSICYCLVIVFSIETAQWVCSYFNQPFEATFKTGPVLSLPTTALPSFSFSFTTGSSYLTPVTHGLTTLVLATAIYFWVKTLKENSELKTELGGVI